MVCSCIATAARGEGVTRVATEDVVPGKLTVTVFAHTIARVRCWTFASAGLWPLGQRELLFSVKQDGDEFPRELFTFYRTVHRLASEKRFVNQGGLTQLARDATPLLRKSSFRGVIYAAPQPLEDIPVAAPYLTGILVTTEEVEAAQRYGAARVLARLGQNARYFPTPPWSDRGRAAVVQGEEQSILSHVPGMPLRGAVVRQEATLRERTEVPGVGPQIKLAGEWVVLNLPPEAPGLLAKGLAGLAPTAPFALFTDIDVAGGSALVWHPGDTAPASITAAKTVNSMGGSFVLFAGSPGDQGANLIEDGFAVTMSEQQFGELREALSKGKPFRVAPSPGRMEFSLRVLLPKPN